MKRFYTFKLSLIWLLVVGLFFVVKTSVLAAPFTRATIRYDRMAQSTLSTLQVTIVPATVGTEAKVKLIFASATVGSSLAVTTTNLDTGVTLLPGTLVAARVGTSEIDITGVTDLTVGTTYGFNISPGVTTPAAGTANDIVRSTTSGDVTIDETTVASRWITNDQIVITAIVPPSFTFTISGNTDVFTTNLSSTAISTTNGRTISATTNAAKGWTGWVKSANAALTSATTGESIGTTGVVGGAVVPCALGTDCYILDVGISATGTGSGALTVATSYAGVGTTDGGALSTTFQPFVYRTGKTNGDYLLLYARAGMIATKAAATDYTDTLTVVGAGNF